jgi:hypothetical protein
LVSHSNGRKYTEGGRKENVNESEKKRSCREMEEHKEFDNVYCQARIMNGKFIAHKQ